MKLLTPSQSRAARGLLNWTQPDLAERCDMHVQTISNFEQDIGSPTKKTLQKITQTFENYGVDIMENGGVKPNTDKIIILSGADGFAAFFENVYDTAKGREEPNICVVNADDKLFLQWHSKHAPEYIQKMGELKIKPARSLLSKKDCFRAADKYSHYRWIDQAIPSTSSLYLYGRKAAIIDFKENDVEIAVVNNLSTTQMLRSMFEVLWERASEI